MLNRTGLNQRLFGWGWGVPALTMLAVLINVVSLGCQSNPVTIAKTPLQKAYAVYGEFVIAEESAQALVYAKTTPPSVVASIKRADALAKPSADALLHATLDVTAATREINTGTGSQDKLHIVQANLTQWLTHAQTDIGALTAAVQGK